MNSSAHGITESDLDNAFWDYSLSLWQNEELEQLCMMLQEEWSLDINLVLFCAWLAQDARRLNPDHRAIMHAQTWHTQAVLPARQYRLNASDKAKALSEELHAERIEQAILYLSTADHPQSEVESNDYFQINVSTLYGFRDERFSTVLNSLSRILDHPSRIQ